MHFVRFDTALLNIRTDSVASDIQHLYDQYPAFMPSFVEDILGFREADTAALSTALVSFLNDTLTRQSVPA